MQANKLRQTDVRVSQLKIQAELENPQGLVKQ